MLSLYAALSILHHSLHVASSNLEYISLIAKAQWGPNFGHSGVTRDEAHFLRYELANVTSYMNWVEIELLSFCLSKYQCLGNFSVVFLLNC